MYNFWIQAVSYYRGLNDRYKGAPFAARGFDLLREGTTVLAYFGIGFRGFRRVRAGLQAAGDGGRRGPEPAAREEEGPARAGTAMPGQLPGGPPVRRLGHPV